jgi:hypothetical protein
MAEAIVLGMKGATAAEKEKKEKYAAHEKVKIPQLRLHEGEWELVPPIYDKIVETGGPPPGQQWNRSTVPMTHSRVPIIRILIDPIGLGCKRPPVRVARKPGVHYSCHRAAASPFSCPTHPLKMHQQPGHWRSDQPGRRRLLQKPMSELHAL